LVPGQYGITGRSPKVHQLKRHFLGALSAIASFEAQLDETGLIDPGSSVGVWVEMPGLLEDQMSSCRVRGDKNTPGRGIAPLKAAFASRATPQIVFHDVG
jgi:hypothetical protein